MLSVEKLLRAGSIADRSTPSPVQAASVRPSGRMSVFFMGNPESGIGIDFGAAL
jgi:hypothetical protein